MHVWRADLAEALRRADGEQVLAVSLSAEERTRAEAIFDRERRALWTAARALLRTLLGRYLHTAPEALAIVADADGKPRLHPRAGTRLSFSLSHSGSIALYAFSCSAPLGVDVECARRPRDYVAIARRVLGNTLAAHLEELDPPEREHEFLRAWTRHEAALKLHGTGFARSGRAANGGRTGPCDGTDPAAVGADNTPWIADLIPGPRTAGALATALAPAELCCWSWSGL